MASNDVFGSGYRNPQPYPYYGYQPPEPAMPAPDYGPVVANTSASSGAPIRDRNYLFAGEGPLAGMNLTTIAGGNARFKKLARRELAQGNAALAAANALYDPTLALVQRSASDYGDVFRAEGRKALEDELSGQTRRRSMDLQDFANLSPEYIAQLRLTNPLLGALYDQAQEELAMGSNLNPVEARQVEEYVRRGQATRGMGLGPADVYQEALTKSEFGQGLKERRRTNAVAASGLFGDVFSAVTGRTGGSGAPQGARISSPYSGTSLEDLFSTGINREIQGRNLNAASGARREQLWGGIAESLISSIGSIAGGAAGACWVARAVFGVRSPKWRQFRVWLLTRAPEKFRSWYIQHGERFAAKLRRRPQTKLRLRHWMESKIAEMTPVPI